jgi:hypothetical protein
MKSIQGQLAKFYEHGDVHSGFMNAGNFLVFKKDSVK